MTRAVPSEPAGTPPQDDHRWLERFLLWGAAAATTTAMVALGLWLSGATLPGPAVLTAVIAGVIGPVLLLAWLAVRRGHPWVASVAAAGVLLLASVGTAVAIPFQVAQPLVLVLLGFVIARQHVRGRTLAVVAIGCWLVSVVDLVILLVRHGYTEPVDFLFGVLPIAAVMGSLLGLLAWFADRTSRALDEERAAGAALAAANAELEASRELSSQVTEAVPGLVLVYETESGTLVYGNARGRRPVEEFGDAGSRQLAGFVERVVHPDERAVLDAWRIGLADAHDDAIRLTAARLLMPEGWRWFDIRGKVFRRGPDGRPTHVLALGLDATAERTATLQRDRFFELAGDAFVVIGDDARIIEAAPALAAMIGVEPGDLVGLSMRGIGHPDDRPAVAAVMRDLAHGHTRGTATMRYRRADGEWRSIEWTLAIDPEDATMYGTARDVTERQATRDALEKGRRLETGGRLAGGGAHDVNNALTAIGGFASLIADTSDGPEVRELAAEIGRSVDRTAIMTRKLLAFSRRLALAPRIVDLGAVLQELGPVVAQLVTEAIEVVVDLRPAPRVLVDPAGIEQIVMNLAVNARDAMPAGGRLTVRSGTVILDGAADGPTGPQEGGRYAELVVSDTGTGMPDAVRSRIFEPFFSTKGDAGTGLGLAIVHGLVTGAGGTIDVSSVPGRGTSVRILLPEAAPATGEPEAAGAAAAPATPSRHVLVGEDEPPLRRLAEVVLRRAGHRVTVAGDGEEALALLADHDGHAGIDLLVTDIVMPGMSGIELARLVRDRYPTLPIAFTSGYDQGLMPSEGPFAGAPLLEKPYSPADLVAAVAAVSAGPGARD